MAKGSNSFIRKNIRLEVMLEPHCYYCGETVAEFHCDHIVPPQKGGMPVRGNFRKACARCNASKSDRSLASWLDHCIKKRDVVYMKTLGYLHRAIWARKRNNTELLVWLWDKINKGRAEHSKWTYRISTLQLMVNG